MDNRLTDISARPAASIAADGVARELMDTVASLPDIHARHPAVANRLMHETLVQVCAEGLKHTRYGFGDLNAQVETLVRMLHIPAPEANAIRQMRRDSNHSRPLTPEQLRYDMHALATLVGRVYRVAVPSALTDALSRNHPEAERRPRANTPDRRAIVRSWDENVIRVVIDEDPETGDTADGQPLYEVRYTEETQYARMGYLAGLLREGMQLGLLGCHAEGRTLTPRLIVVEPDCLIDISTIASCFEDYGHHPLLYLVSRMRSKANSQPILLGNFAGSALDDIINQPSFSPARTLMNSFRERAMEYSTCPDFDGERFKQDAATQTTNLQHVVEALRQEFRLDRAILEPSFICEKLGIQGRVDLMTTDLQLLVEQKSGRNLFVERGLNNRHGSRAVEKHYVQVLLYYGILYYNFHRSETHIRLLYSRYPLPGGLLDVANLMRLVYEAIRFRNEAVALEFELAHDGPARLLPRLTSQELNTEGMQGFFYDQYLRPQLDEVLRPLQGLRGLERAYFCRMLRFAVRENLMAKVGVAGGVGSCTANLWNMPLAEKKETGNIYTGLHIINKEKSTGPESYGGYDLITLSVPHQGEDFLPNFRRGDMVYLYAYPEDQEPDVRRALLFKGGLAEIHTDSLTVKLADGQQNAAIFDHLPYGGWVAGEAAQGKPFAWCIEHGSSDAGGSAAIQAIYELVTSTPDRKALLLGQRVPRCDKTVTLSRSYDAELDPLLLRAKQARDFFLLVGPPGTGKTSRALRYLVEEALAASPNSSILLLSYTNRAVDEICGMLVEAGIGFIRLGHELSCAPAYAPYLVSNIVGESPRLDDMRGRLLRTRVVVSTTSMLQSRPFIFSLKHFSLAIVDESSQILEPSIIGLLASHRPTVSPADGAAAAMGGGPTCNIDKFILIGDYKQLPAVVQQNDEEARVTEPELQAIGLTNCKNSLFERLIRQEQAADRTDFIGTLRRQGRMHPAIAEFPGETFYFAERLVPVPLRHQQETELGYALPAQDRVDELLKRHRLLFFASEDCRQPDLSDKVNAAEARLVASLLRRIRRFYGSRFEPDKTVGVIVPYRNQIAMIRQEIELLGLPGLEQVSIDTVERYQGSQRDVIIYSFTIQQRWQLGFLTANSFYEDGRLIDRKLNVALTRARKQLLLTGNARTLAASPLFSQLMDYIRARGGYISQENAEKKVKKD